MQNRPVEALALVERNLANADMVPSYKNVRLYALKALAYFQKKDYGNALAALEKTLKLAEPENRVVSFVREGAAMERLLRLAQGKSSETEFIRRVLAAFEVSPQIQTGACSRGRDADRAIERA